MNLRLTFNPWVWVDVAFLQLFTVLGLSGAFVDVFVSVKVFIPGFMTYAVYPTSFLVFGSLLAFVGVGLRKWKEAFFATMMAGAVFDGTGSLMANTLGHDLYLGLTPYVVWTFLAIIAGFMLKYPIRNGWFWAALLFNTTYWLLMGTYPNLLARNDQILLEMIPEFVCCLGVLSGLRGVSLRPSADTMRA